MGSHLLHFVSEKSTVGCCVVTITACNLFHTLKEWKTLHETSCFITFDCFYLPSKENETHNITHCSSFKRLSHNLLATLDVLWCFKL